MDIITYAMARKFTVKSMSGLGALRGSPCKIKSIQPVYSTEDPTVVLKNVLTLQWDSNNNPDPSATPDWHEEQVEILDNGRGVYTIEMNGPKSTAEKTWYTITFYDGTTDEFYIPTSSGSLKKKVVAALPSADMADKNAIYLVPVPGKAGSYQQWLAVENDLTHAWEWLSLGTTDVDLSVYQTKIDPNINKVYPNYDPATKGESPTARNLVGAVNEFNNVLGATYDYTNNEIANLTTHHKETVVSALNELGDITTAEAYDEVNRNTFVKLIDAANSEYTIEQGVVDRTKYVDVLSPKRDARDGTPKTDAGLDIKVPRVDIVKRITADENDFRTYDLKVGDEFSDANDPNAKLFGQIHLPKIKIKKNDPPEMTTTDTTHVDAWTNLGGVFQANITLEHSPLHTETVAATIVPSIGGATVTVDISEANVNAVVKIAGTGFTPGPADVTYTFDCENPVLAAEYYLEIEGQDWSEPVSGAKIEIAKSMVLKSGTVKKCVQDGVPLANLLVGDLYIDLEFATGPVAQHAYIAIKDMFKPYEGEKAISIEYDSADEINKVKLVIDDPDNHEALVQTDDGLRLMLATEEQKGIVERATEAEERAAIDSTRYITPLQLHDFVVNSDSVKGDLGNLYTDADGNIVNNTVISAINESASARVKELDVPEDGDVKTYIVQTKPDENVWRQLGDKIHDKQVVYQVDKLSTVTGPKKYEIYYLNEIETIGDVEYRPGLYVYDETALAWVSASTSGGIIQVEELPTEHINDQCFYLVPDNRVVVGRYGLTDAAILAGYSANENGIDLAIPPQHWSWSQISMTWSEWIGDELEEKPNGEICHLNDNSIVYDYLEETNHLYYHYKTEWIEAPVVKAIPDSYIDGLEMWM